ncbi:hypothetical protein BDV95DRAFT_600600 [Massariosphaeria phaeospora]|uniref:Uncharacterized protein n=1 Tax=Massariosphaeria phaeospora TaxID=100035 RepID=A0A7C8MY83_9PLEO|nr:hypothetical protein BDV95DRAFT_600600 [Massariosphaeria phaeospora]
MKLQLSLLTFLFAQALAQQAPAECTRELARTDDCANVINANACYNAFGFRDAQTLQCVDGTDNKDRARKACKCCNCVGQRMCDYVTKQKLC